MARPPARPPKAGLLLLLFLAGILLRVLPLLLLLLGAGAAQLVGRHAQLVGRHAQDANPFQRIHLLPLFNPLPPDFYAYDSCCGWPRNRCSCMSSVPPFLWVALDLG